MTRLVLIESGALAVMSLPFWDTTRRHPENWKLIKQALRGDDDGDER